jgi:L,D-transpeptidase catalytic domain/Sel1 repeat
MTNNKLFHLLVILLALTQFVGCASAPIKLAATSTSLGPIVELPAIAEPYRLVISVHDQQMTLLKGSTPVARYLVSTAKQGVGEAVDSGQTPRGRHAIAEKIGAGVTVGTVFEDRIPTNEFVAVNAWHRTQVVTRILRLRGLEDRNQATFDRLIYLHGSPAEHALGSPASGGCIRMRSAEIVDLFERVEVGTEIFIFEEPTTVALALLAESDVKLAALQQVAESGATSALSQLCYGHMYGAHGIPMNDAAALRWCTKAADKNNPNAITLLGEIHERGKGVAVDLVTARNLYERAAKLGHSYAQFTVAQMYKAGTGGAANEALARQYVELSAKQGFAPAQKQILTGSTK